MTPRTHTPPRIRPGIVQVGEYDVLIRPHPGVSTPPWIWDVLDTDERTGLRVVVASFCSYPDESNCATAISNHRAKRSVAKVIDEATARAQYDLHRYGGRVATDGSVRQVRNGRNVVPAGKAQQPRPPATQEREVEAVTVAFPVAPAAPVKRRGPRRDWTPAEDETLRRHYADEIGSEVAKRLPGRSVTSVYQRLQKLRLTRGKGRRPGQS